MVAAALIDTNILVDHLRGIPAATKEIGFYPDLAISSITWMELMTKSLAMLQQRLLAPTEFRDIEDSLNLFPIIHIDDGIMREAARVRAASIVTPPKIALPDAIIRATGNVTSRLLVTRNTKDFRGAGVRHPYVLTSTNTGSGAVEIISSVAPPPS